MVVIEQYMARHKLTQKKFARRVGVTQSMVSQWLRGARPISPESAKRIEKRTGGEIQRVQILPELFA